MEERYIIGERIGQGGLGSVYKGYDTRINREVAIKRISVSADEPSLLEESTRQLIKEAGALASLQHPHIVTIYDVGSDEDGPYVVMELISGKTLEELIENAPLTWTDFRELALQTQEALIAAQELHIIHSDIKPSNLMLTWLPSGKFQIKIVDFGLATLAQSQSQEELAETKCVFGSIFFMAPEQFERIPIDARADLYSMACVYYQALTGTYPFRGETTSEVMNAHLQHQVTPIQNFRSDIPLWACEWIMWQLNRRPDDRPDSARDSLYLFLKNDKESTASGGHGKPTPPQRSAPRTKRQMATVTTKQVVASPQQKSKGTKVGVTAAVGIGAVILGVLFFKPAKAGNSISSVGPEESIQDTASAPPSSSLLDADSELPRPAEILNNSGILWNICSRKADNIHATAEDFTAAGVTESLTGIALANIEVSNESGRTSIDPGTGITLTLTDNRAQGCYSNAADLSAFEGTAITKEYITLRGSADRAPGPIKIQLGGLADHLTENTIYSFYLWGIGDVRGQNSTFEFNEESLVVADGDPCTNDADYFMVKYSFTTGTIVADTLDFTWSMTADRLNSRNYAGFNGFAIVSNPNP